MEARNQDSRAELKAKGLEEKEKVTSGGEIIYRITPSVRAAMSKAKLQDRTLQLVREFAARPDVEYAQLNYILRISDRTPNDPRYPEQWHYFSNAPARDSPPAAFNLPKAWDVFDRQQRDRCGRHRHRHPTEPSGHSRIPNLVAGYDMISDAFIGNDGGGRDSDPTDPGDAAAAGECYPGSPALPDSWHGTHVAGTIGVGNTNNGIGVAGINWNVKLQAVRVLGKCGGTTADINDGIRWAAGLSVPGVPSNSTPAKVINMSLGTPPGNPCSLSPLPNRPSMMPSLWGQRWWWRRVMTPRTPPGVSGQLQ